MNITSKKIIPKHIRLESRESMIRHKHKTYVLLEQLYQFSLSQLDILDAEQCVAAFANPFLFSPFPIEDAFTFRADDFYFQNLTPTSH